MPKSSLPKSSSTLSRYILAFLPAIIWASFIFYLSSQSILPGVGVNNLDFISKKIGHLTVYAILWWLIHRAVKITNPYHPHLALWLPFVLVLIYAASDEFHQSFVPGRYPSPRDIGYDLLGASVAWLKRYEYL